MKKGWHIRASPQRTVHQFANYLDHSLFLISTGRVEKPSSFVEGSLKHSVSNSVPRLNCYCKSVHILFLIRFMNTLTKGYFIHMILTLTGLDGHICHSLVRDWKDINVPLL